MARREFLDARLSPIKPRHKLMLLILDEVARTDPFLWLGNAEAAARYGCTTRHAAVILGEMEREGLILRVLTTSVDSGDERLGILLLQRADPNRPVIADEASKALAMQSLVVRATSLPFATERAPSPPPPGAIFSAPRARFPAPPRALKIAPELESCSKEHELNKQRAGGASSRRRPETEQPKAEATGDTPGEIAAAAAPVPEPAEAGPPGLTPGQREFLAGLTIDQRSRFDAWSEIKRAETLAMFRGGLDRCILGETLRMLAPPKGPPLPPPDVPTPELIAALSGPMGGSLAARCASAIMVTLGDRGEDSFGVIHHLCGEVVNGARDPDSMAVPLARTVEAIARGEPIRNPAGYWMRSVRNWERERSSTDPR